MPLRPDFLLHPVQIDPLGVQNLASRNALLDIETQKGRADLAGEQAMRNAFAQPGAIDVTTGQISPQAISGLMAASPRSGMAAITANTQMQQKAALAQQEKAHALLYDQMLQDLKDKGKARLHEVSDNLLSVGLGASDNAEKYNSDPLARNTSGQTAMNKEIDRWEQLGTYTPQEIASLRKAVPGFNYEQDKALLRTKKQIMDQIKVDQKQEARPAKWTAEGLAFRPGTNTALEVYDQQQGWRPFTGTVPTDLKLIGGPEVAMYTNVTPPSGSTPAVGLSKTSGQFENIPTKPGTQIPTGIKGDISLSGQEYMDSLPPEQQDLVKGIAEGRINPTTFSTKGGHRENIMAMVTRYDPSYNQTRPATWKEFTTGATARNITSINTSLSHMDNMYDLADAMKNNDVRLANAVLNRLATETGRPEITNFEVARQAVGDELMRTFRQVGASEIEAKDWRDRFASAGSPEQLKGAIKTAGKLLQGRLDAVNQQWKRGTQLTTDFPDIVSPQNQNVLAKIGVSKSTGVSPASGMPAVGDERGGYRFKGGDPAQQGSWEKI